MSPGQRAVRQNSSWATGPLLNVDDLIRSELAERVSKDPDYWTFAMDAERDDVHGYFRYPAMMVPRVQRELLALLVKLQPEIHHLLDPFAGSGTVLTEAMYQGLTARVQDVNPLALLLCKAKTGPFVIEDLRGWSAEIGGTARGDKSNVVEADFKGIQKWFRDNAALQLSQLRRAIRKVPETWARRFFWVALAETVRRTSNSRTSTYKLHVRPAEEIDGLPNPLEVFEQVAHQNLVRIAGFAAALKERGFLVDDRYSSAISCVLQDARLPTDGRYDLLITSPPYGDNRSTIPYGQHAYLPLQWIDQNDIEIEISGDPLKSTYEVDNWGLGGALIRRSEVPEAAELAQMSPTLARLVEKLEGEPPDRLARVLTFVRDLCNCLPPVLEALRPNAYSVWTIGNRRVGGHQIPLDEVLCELMSSRGALHVATIDRRIPSKRMATRNNIASSTIRSERILIFRKLPTGEEENWRPSSFGMASMSIHP